MLYPFEACQQLYVRPVLTFKILHGDYLPFMCPQNQHRLSPYTTLRVALYNRGWECLQRGTDCVLI